MAHSAVRPSGAGHDAGMTFTWTTPPWERHEDCTHTAVTCVETGDEGLTFASAALRGDNAIEALADHLVMDPGARATAFLPGLVAVVVRRGIDVMWMAEPPIRATFSSSGEWGLAVYGVEEADVTAFSPREVQDLLAQLRAAYPSL